MFFIAPDLVLPESATQLCDSYQATSSRHQCCRQLGVPEDFRDYSSIQRGSQYSGLRDSRFGQYEPVCRTA